MKALIIRQPWAWAIVFAGKNVENRVWTTAHRGEIAIHASNAAPAADWLPRGVRVPDSAELSRGAIIGVAELVDVVERSRSKWFGGPFGFVLANARPLPEPMPCKGMLRLWTVPADIESAVRSKLAGVE